METLTAAAVFAALSQETRLDLMRLLIAEGAIRTASGRDRGAPRSSGLDLSFHLAALERAGLTQSTRQGRQIVHAVRIVGSAANCSLS